MKTVAIVGAGPGGLVAAKALLQSKHTTYSVRIFEKAASVGGLWAVDREKPHEGMLNPDMPTNISKFNVGYSDFSWKSADIPGYLSYFPKAWMAGRYLAAYAKRFIPPDSISLNTKVVEASKVAEPGSSEKAWQLKWEHRDLDNQVQTGIGVFDYLVIAGGFFPESWSAPTNLPEHIGLPFKQAHSTKVRSLADLAPDDKKASGTILIVGGSVSGADIAGVLAAHRSDSIHRPGSGGDAYRNLKLVQIVPKSFYAIPLMVPRLGDTPYMKAPEFIALDLALYDLGKRPPGDIKLGIGRLAHDFIAKSHDYFRGVMGGDQGELGQPAMQFDDEEDGVSSRVALTEQYAEFLRSGDVSLLRGRLADLEIKQGDGTVTATIDNGGQKSTIDDVLGVVYATGFRPFASANILSAEIQEELEYDPASARLPLILDMDTYYTSRSEVSNLAFVGYHEGQSWPGMEMQARMIEKLWASNPATSADVQSTQDASRQTLRSIRNSMAEGARDLPMYFLGDYAGLMESIAREVGINRNDLDWAERTGPVTAARYAADRNDPETQLSLEALHSDLAKSRDEARFVPRAAFRAMQGTWKISRRLKSFLVGFPSGSLEGTASFCPRYSTDPLYDAEYLYMEQGTFKNDQGLSFTASRRYVYRYQESVDRITVWFVKEDGKTVDYFFHDLAFDPSNRTHGWIAKADHLCVKDMYNSKYCFEFRGANIRKMDIIHTVKGPQKNYISTTTYTRESPVYSTSNG